MEEVVSFKWKGWQLKLGQIVGGGVGWGRKATALRGETCLHTLRKGKVRDRCVWGIRDRDPFAKFC